MGLNHSTWREAESAALAAIANARQQGAREHSICYADAQGRWRSLSCSPDDLPAAREYIQDEGGEVAMVDGHWAFPAPLP